MKKFTLLVALLFAFSFAQAQQNILLIIADDLGADYCGFTPGANDTANMPNVRSLIPKSVYFTNAWASPYCSSTRAGMLTGRYSFRHGVGTVIGGSGSNDLDSAEVTIADMLKYHAPLTYRTANIGKWHVNQQTPIKTKWPTQKFGYDLYKGNFLGELSDYYNWTKITNGLQTDTITTYATTETVNDAIAWLDTLPSNKPFFMWLAFNAPHSPFHLPPANLHTVPGLTGTPQHINANRSLYFKAMTEAMDTEIGRLIQWMKTNNRFDSTTIIFMGDNGNDKRVSQIADSSHVKGTLYDYGVHVPFLISGNRVVNPNRSSDALVNVQDVFGTTMDLANFTNWVSAYPSTNTLDSKSLYPILINQLTDVRDYSFTELFTTPTATVQDGKTIRTKDYHLIRFDNGQEAFYHIAVDPEEQLELLSTSMTSNDTGNYILLCNYMNALLATPYCSGALSTRDVQTLSPNFQSNSDYLQASFEKDFTWQLLSLEGKVILNGRSDKKRLLLSTNNLVPGYYIFQLVANNQRWNYKWIKN
ncbi:MAG: sulfatase-like hydrolase/transferase [Chitinophagaceae bacterium]|nr:sulfatase-like hydrolase/transferase [Chitinophagaceae bacterium]